MKRQRGTTAVIILIALVTVLALVGVIGTVSYISAANYGNEAEQGIKAQWDDNRNTLAQYVQKIKEAAQVPDMMRDDLTKVVEAALTARYGDQGSKAMFQWIQEQNPTLDSKVYVKLQQIIEAGRDEFKNKQTLLIDKKRAYETSLGYFYRGFFLKLAGHPKMDLSKFNIVTNDYTEGAFKAGKEEGPVKLR